MNNEIIICVRKLADVIRNDIRNLDGGEVSLDPIEGRILENDLEGCINELFKLTKYKEDLISGKDSH